jgi:hypothetical protein
MTPLSLFALFGWTASVAVPAMLWALAGVSIPVIIHLLSRRRATVVDWGAMQFLELGRRAQRKFQLSELLLMMGRMALLALVALAAARPLLSPSTPAPAPGAQLSALGPRSSGTAPMGEPRDVVLVLDGSESMGRSAGGTTPRRRAVDWSRGFLKRLPEGSGVAVLDARERVRPLVDRLNYDRLVADKALAQAPEPRGGSDLAAALSEALQILETGRNPQRDVILVSDGQRAAWRPAETTRWGLLRDLYTSAQRANKIVPALWAVNLEAPTDSQGLSTDAGVAPLVLDRGLVPVGLPMPVRTAVRNSGSAPTERMAELFVDEVAVPGSLQRVGPIPPAGQVPVRFETVLAAPGSHRLSVRLRPADDPLTANDESETTVEAAEGLPVLLVDGQPGQGAFQGPADFIRAALTPADDAAPAVRARTLPLNRFSTATKGEARVIVLAAVPRLDADQREAVESVLDAGGGLLIVPGEALDAAFWSDAELLKDGGWLPASSGPVKGRLATRRGATPAVVGHLDPRSFTGAVMPPFGEGDDPALARAGLFWFRSLEPAPNSVVAARLGTGEPWLVEKTVGRARVVELAGTLDARGGTLPANPDFVPWLHFLIFHLAEPGSAARVFQPGEMIRIEVAEAPAKTGMPLDVHTPDGRQIKGELAAKGPRGEIRFSDSAEPGIYRVDPPLAGGPSGPVYLQVGSDAREAEPARLDNAEAAKLAEGWPFQFASDPDALAARVLSVPGGGTRPVWRWLVLLALVGLCLEVLATRRLARQRGLTAEGEGA